jgi:hypothetical protein
MNRLGAKGSVAFIAKIIPWNICELCRPLALYKPRLDSPAHLPLCPPRLIKRERQRKADKGTAAAAPASHGVLQQREPLQVAPPEPGQPEA